VGDSLVTTAAWTDSSGLLTRNCGEEAQLVGVQQ
jgi:hypothetical protein